MTILMRKLFHAKWSESQGVRFWLSMFDIFVSRQNGNEKGRNHFRESFVSKSHKLWFQWNNRIYLENFKLKFQNFTIHGRVFCDAHSHWMTSLGGCITCVWMLPVLKNKKNIFQYNVTWFWCILIWLKHVCESIWMVQRYNWLVIMKKLFEWLVIFDEVKFDYC